MRKFYRLPQLRLTQSRGERREAQRFSRAVQTTSVIDGYLLSFNKNVTTRERCVHRKLLGASSRSRRLRVSRNFPALLAAMLAFGASACRDAPLPPTEPERTDAPQNNPLQLTYSVQDDRAPAWSANGDTVYYVAHIGLRDNRPVTELRAIPRTAGIAREMLPALGPDADSVWLAQVAPSPDRSSVAFARVSLYFTRLLEPEGTTWICDGDLAARVDSQFGPRLGVVDIHAIARGNTLPLVQQNRKQIALSGRQFVDQAGTIVRFHPFQRLWDREALLPFRPAWSPDGQRLAFSDGLGIHIWNTGTGADPEFVLGTEDGVTPAWSPDGDWIAFTRLNRGVSAFARCYIPTFPPQPFQERTVWESGDRVLVISSPDGSTQVDLGIGEDPAWSPDGRYIYARRNDAIWRIAADGSGALEVAGTSGGREPVVSPSGDHLAFARLTAKGDYDIWVVGLK